MYDELCRIERLQAAWKKVRANGAATGGDGVSRATFERALDHRLLRLQAALESGRYRPGPLRRVALRRADGRIRLLRIPGIGDRVVQAACQRLLSERLDARMSRESFAYRPARSVPMALARLRQLARGNRWALDADIDGFFDNVPHGRLVDELSIWIEDPRLVRLIGLWLGSFGREHGLAQGAPIAPVLANLYLHPLDVDLERRGLAHVRYADDFVVLTASRRHALATWTVVADLLRRRGLALQMEKTRIVHLSQGLDFLGERFQPG